MNRREFSARLAGAATFGTTALATTTPLIARAQAAAEPVEGRHYSRIDPTVPPSASGKVEVFEFFSYACPHCSAFEPAVEAWSKTLPAHVAFQRVPVPFLMNADNFMKTYYAIETLGRIDSLQRKVFTAVHVDRLRLDTPAEIAALMAKNGVDSAKFLEVFGSFSVASSVTRAKKLAATYKVESVPSLAVGGRYATSPATAGGSEQALAVVDYLVQRSRKG